MAPSPALRRLVSDGALDIELAALLWLLAEQGVPVVVAGRDRAAAQQVTAALPRPSGALVADSLDEVVRLAGGSADGGLPDELRDMGVVLVVRAANGRPRVVVAHYIRPLERDAGGHVQRRGPVVLAAWDESAGDYDHFAWGVAAELAERAGLPLVDFERRRAEYAASLTEPSSDEPATAR